METSLHNIQFFCLLVKVTFTNLGYDQSLNVIQKLVSLRKNLNGVYFFSFLKDIHIIRDPNSNITEKKKKYNFSLYFFYCHPWVIITNVYACALD